MWLATVATGDLADALHRDLFQAGRTVDELGWRGLWAYITCAPPGSAIYHRRTEGWGLGDKIGAELVYELRKLNWRYTALHFQGGKDASFPDPIPYPGAGRTAQQQAAAGWETATLDDIVSPEVRALLQGA